MKSKTKISKQIERKTNPVLVETVFEAKKSEGWLPVAAILSGPRKGFVDINILEINEYLKELKNNEVLVVPGKILSQGDLDKKVNIAAFSFSGKAKEKINSQGKALHILDAIKQDPEGKNIKIITK